MALQEFELQCCESGVRVFVEAGQVKDFEGFLWNHSSIGHVVKVEGEGNEQCDGTDDSHGDDRD